MKRDVTCIFPDPDPTSVLTASVEVPGPAAPPSSTLPDTLSPAFVASAARRLGLVGLTVACGVAAGAVLNLFGRVALGWGTGNWLPNTSRLVGSILLFVMSAGMFVASRSRFEPRRLLDLGSAYQVLGAVVLVLPRYATDRHLQEMASSVGWLGVWILLFPLFVPGRPLKTVASSLLAASAAPAVYLAFAFTGGRDLPTFKILVGTFFPYYFCAVLGAVPAFLMHRLGRAMAEAEREVQRLGSYRLLDLLGQGGMGEVWRAEHRMLARPAAIKLIKTERLQGGTPSQRSEVQARFAREAQATAALTSPHTIGLFDYGATPEGTLYYVMELLHGIDLDSMVKRAGPLPPARVVHLLAQACDSLAEAHQAGLIHRDVKPANVFCCRVGCDLDFVKVLDFGLVHLARGERETPRSGDEPSEAHVVGTPAFMAPEQAECRSDLDGRVDVYALGAVGFWLLTGTHVFESESTLEALVHVMKTDPVRPSERLGEPLPEDLDALIHACLAKDKLLRPPSARGLKARLLACDVPAWTQDDARAWWKEHLPELGAPSESDASTRTVAQVDLPS